MNTKSNIISLQQNGVLVLNKAKGPSSAACLGVIKRKLGQKKIGHAGTLDPMASGVLLVLLGQATKISGYLLSAGQKTYSAVVEFGKSSDTWDAEGKINSANLSLEEIKTAVQAKSLEAQIKSWIGISSQEVPPFSAAKHQGQPLYKLARKGLETPVKIKDIEISRAELEWFEPPLARFRIACSSGTYIRSLAHSLGKGFGCGAILIELVREYSHPFSLDEAVSLEELIDNPNLLSQKVQSIAKALPQMPLIELNKQDSLLVKNGTALATNNFVTLAESQAIFVDDEQKPLALVEKKICNNEEVWAIGRGLWNN